MGIQLDCQRYAFPDTMSSSKHCVSEEGSLIFPSSKKENPIFRLLKSRGLLPIIGKVFFVQRLRVCDVAQ